MENSEISRIFDEIAELLDLKGENSFKVKAYQKAARTVDSLAQPLSDFKSIKELTQIPGIGQSIAEKIMEIVATGDCRLHQELKSEFPPQILVLLSVPALGPKKAAILYRELGIGNLEELKTAAQADTISGIKGFGAKTQENILKGIELVTSTSGRKSIAQALPLARELLKILSQLPQVSAASEAGSLRRRKETIGDIDLLVASEQPQAVMDYFVKLPWVKKIIAHGETKSSVLTAQGLQIDLRVVGEASYGAALQYFTGSKDHNVELRGRAKDLELKINEYGVFRQNQPNSLAGRTEEEVYKTIGLPYIPPEIREARGEIEAALKHQLPRLVDLKEIKGDFHIHSNFSDGSADIGEMARAAKALGYQYLVLTDHSQSLKIAGGLTPERLREQQKQIDEWQEKLKPFRIFKGTEIDILADGSLDYPPEVLKSFDIVIVSIHSLMKMDKAAMTRRIITAVENPYTTILGHPTGRLIGQRDEFEVDWEAIYPVCAKNQVALEINAFPDRLDLRDIYCQRAKEFGCIFTIGTDSHSTGHLHHMEYGVFVARRGWLEKSEILNCLPLEELEKWIQQRKKKLKI